MTINVFTSVLCTRNFSRAFKMQFFGWLLNVFCGHTSLVPRRSRLTEFWVLLRMVTSPEEHSPRTLTLDQTSHGQQGKRECLETKRLGRRWTLHKLLQMCKMFISYIVIYN